PAWSLYDLLMMAGLVPTGAGYRVVPHIPGGVFDVRFPEVGVAEQTGMLRGYLRPQQGGVLSMAVAIPPGVDPTRAEAWVNGRIVASVLGSDHLLHFEMPAPAARTTDWAITGPGGAPQ
ncbi:MAG: hypothetical protein ACYCSJ_12955, partial [Acidimicrobiales bacterium]